MELKKSPKADSNAKRVVYLGVGLILALLVVVVVGLIFVLRAVAVVEPILDTPEEHRIERLGNIEAVVEEQIVEITHQDQKPPEASKKVEMKAMADMLSIVKNDAKETTDVDFSDFDEEAKVVRGVEGKEEAVDDEPFFYVDQMPTFQGGDISTFRDWVQKNVRYSQIAQENGISGKVILSFVIERDGSLTNIKVLYTPDKSLSEEAIRVLKQSPKWAPGRQDGNAVRVSFNLPVDFSIQQ